MPLPHRISARNAVLIPLFRRSISLLAKTTTARTSPATILSCSRNFSESSGASNDSNSLPKSNSASKPGNRGTSLPTQQPSLRDLARERHFKQKEAREALGQDVTDHKIPGSVTIRCHYGIASESLVRKVWLVDNAPATEVDNTPITKEDPPAANSSGPPKIRYHLAAHLTRRVYLDDNTTPSMEGNRLMARHQQDRAEDDSGRSNSFGGRDSDIGFPLRKVYPRENTPSNTRGFSSTTGNLARERKAAALDGLSNHELRSRLGDMAGLLNDRLKWQKKDPRRKSPDARLDRTERNVEAILSTPMGEKIPIVRTAGILTELTLEKAIDFVLKESDGAIGSWRWKINEYQERCMERAVKHQRDLTKNVDEWEKFFQRLERVSKKLDKHLQGVSTDGMQDLDGKIMEITKAVDSSGTILLWSDEILELTRRTREKKNPTALPPPARKVVSRVPPMVIRKVENRLPIRKVVVDPTLPRGVLIDRAPEGRRQFSTSRILEKASGIRQTMVEKERERLEDRASGVNVPSGRKAAGDVEFTDDSSDMGGGFLMGGGPCDDPVYGSNDSIYGSFSLQKGDLCEIRGNGAANLGIYIRQTKDGEPTVDILSRSGVLSKCKRGMITFTLPEFVKEKLINDFLKVHVKREEEAQRAKETEEPIPPRQDTLKILDPVRAFSRDAMEKYSGNLAKFQNLAREFADDTHSRKLSLHEAAKRVFGPRPDNTELYATHIAMMGDGAQFMADKYSFNRSNSTFRVRNKAELNMMDSVTKWVRKAGAELSRESPRPNDPSEGEKKFNAFVDKAKYLIDMSRALRKTPTEKGRLVEKVPVSDITWTADDKFFISYVKSLLGKYGLQKTPIDGLVPSILRATGRYDGQVLDSSVAYEFLGEIGAWSPWENPFLHDPVLDLPGMGHSEQADEDEELLMQEMVRKPAGEFEDSLASIRKDWGDMDVYCVDSEEAHEIDDGISIERVSPIETWIHVHIANPTAFLNPDDIIAEIAGRRVTTKYLTERTYGMLPRELGEKFGLGNDRAVLTFSMRIGKDGETLEYKIQPGLIRNVKTITYEELDKLYGSTQETALDLDIGCFPDPRPKNKQGPSKSQVQDLKDLKEIGARIGNKRMRNGATQMDWPTFDVQVSDGSGNHPHLYDSDMPILYRGHPAIKFRVIPSRSGSAAAMMVTEMMILANNASARWCTDRKIPAPFTTQEYDHSRPDIIDILINKIMPGRDELGFTRITSAFKYLTHIGASKLRTSAGPHRTIGVLDGYLKSTSPLRRFADMIVHWQIQAALKNQELPFTLKHLENDISRLESFDRLGRYISSVSQRFWAAVAVKYALEHGMPELPKRFTMVLMEKAPLDTSSVGMVRELGMPGKVRFEDEETLQSVIPGDEVHAELEKVKLVENYPFFVCKGVYQEKSPRYGGTW